ncbi:hypothetical protein RFI_30846 [Reticulomyxa filosa]|uniref:Protein kinase domain-containing protein n=1 Tax=Reticulomyxa filosa TaxID=46433 RepID=X6LY56_RETFI|nr:hypothetical protein RFI_30846 [Reticulomyxa filosa]|eukprot:ETO06549.1 hypothetical protein RFI_30846 [Reticulomyxa filosa]
MKSSTNFFFPPFREINFDHFQFFLIKKKKKRLVSINDLKTGPFFFFFFFKKKKKCENGSVSEPCYDEAKYSGPPGKYPGGHVSSWNEEAPQFAERLGVPGSNNNNNNSNMACGGGSGNDNTTPTTSDSGSGGVVQMLVNPMLYTAPNGLSSMCWVPPPLTVIEGRNSMIQNNIGATATTIIGKSTNRITSGSGGGGGGGNGKSMGLLNLNRAQTIQTLTSGSTVAMRNVDADTGGGTKGLIASTSEVMSATQGSHVSYHSSSSSNSSSDNVGKALLQRSSTVNLNPQEHKALSQRGSRVNKYTQHLEASKLAEISINDIVFERCIGGGKFGKVHKALWISKTVAVKCLRANEVNEKEFEDFAREICSFFFFLFF